MISAALEAETIVALVEKSPGKLVWSDEFLKHTPAHRGKFNLLIKPV